MDSARDRVVDWNQRLEFMARGGTASSIGRAGRHRHHLRDRNSRHGLYT